MLFCSTPPFKINAGNLFDPPSSSPAPTLFSSIEGRQVSSRWKEEAGVMGISSCLGKRGIPLCLLVVPSRTTLWLYCEVQMPVLRVADPSFFLPDSLIFSDHFNMVISLTSKKGSMLGADKGPQDDALCQVLSTHASASKSDLETVGQASPIALIVKHLQWMWQKC